MKNIIKISLIGMVFLTSCTKDFANINTNPNTTIAATPQSLLAPTIHDLVARNANRAERIGNELMQYTVTSNDSREFQRYVIRPSESDYMWRNWYLQLTNIKDIYANAEATQQPAHETYKGISLILESWVFSMITDMFGDAPFSEANRGYLDKNISPKFDRQKDIYAGIFQKLEEANELLKGGTNLPEEIKELEPLYAGDAKAWRKFGNSLYLRLLMRVSSKSELDPVATIHRIVDLEKALYPMFENNGESAVLKFTSTAPLLSPFTTWRDFDFNGDKGYSEFFINTLSEWDDPRLPIFATEYTLGVYSGMQSGYSTGSAPERQSTIPLSFKNEPRLGNIMNYAELQFILAEASLKGYITSPAKGHYDEGVKNAITFWDVIVPDDYLLKQEIAWDDTETEDGKMDRIFKQKFFTLYFTDFQAWNEYRRTGFPTLIKGPGLRNGGKMPSRLNYPINIGTLNRKSYEEAVAAMGGDDINTKVWWNK